MENSSSLISAGSSSMDTIVHITLSISAKLDRTNFLTWRSQIEPIVNGFGLSGFLDGSFPIPPRQIEIDSKLSPNPAFLVWLKQDQLLLSWLRSSIKETVLAQVLKCQTSADLWKTLHHINSAVSRAKLMDLRRQLQTTTRGGSSCEGYFQKMQNIGDQLNAIGEPISDADLVTYILSGLGVEFNSFVVAINTRIEPIALNDLHGLILGHEALLNSQNSSLTTAISDPTVFYAGKKKYKNPGSKVFQSASTSSAQYRPPSFNFQPRPPLLPTPSTNPSPCVPPGTRYHPGSIPKCQICNKRGHMALECWYICDTNKYPGPPQVPQAHTATSPYQALLSVPNTKPEEGWFLDSGATHHVTSDINNLSSFLPYGGPDHLQVGNGPPHQEIVGTSKPN